MEVISSAPALFSFSKTADPSSRSVLLTSRRAGVFPWHTVEGMGLKRAAGCAKVQNLRPRLSPVAAVREEGLARNLQVPSGDADKAIPVPFVFPESSRSSLAQVFDFDLPVIDLAVFTKLKRLQEEIDRAGAEDVRISDIKQQIAACEVETETVLQQLRTACVEYGFFQIVNHGVPMPLVDNLRNIAQGFFNKPLEEKSRAANAKRLTGYITGLPVSVGEHKTRIWRETFGVRMILGRSGEDSGFVPLAHHLAGETQDAERVSRAVHTHVRTMESLALHILELVAQSFSLPESTFSEQFRDKPDRTCLFQMNHYPKCPQPDLALGTHTHTDPFALNIVHQDQVGGLQVLTSDGQWHGVRPIPGAFVVNIGDLLQLWTNDRLLSAEHRVVVNREQSRMSFCFFYNPSRQAHIVTPAKFIDEQHPQRYRTFQTFEFTDIVASKGASRRGRIIEKFGLNSMEN